MSEIAELAEAIASWAEVLCIERCAQAGDPPCSRVEPNEPHCDECLGMALALRNHINTEKRDGPA